MVDSVVAYLRKPDGTKYQIRGVPGPAGTIPVVVGGSKPSSPDVGTIWLPSGTATGVTYSYMANLPSGTTPTVTHNLGTTDVVVAVYRTSDGVEVDVPFTRDSANVITLNSAVNLAGHRVVVLASGGAAVGTNVRHILSGTIARIDHTIGTAWVPVDLGTIVLVTQSSGNTKLSISGGNIIIGTGVTQVMVSASTTIDGSPTGDKVLNVRKNGTVISNDASSFAYWAAATGGDYWQPMVITNFLLDVTAGDAIDLGLSVSVTGQHETLESSITVEVIA